MTQIELDYGRAARIRRRSDDTRAVIRMIADVVGLKELAFAADMSPSQAHQAIAGNKSLKIELVEAALELAPPELKIRLLSSIAGDGFDVSTRAPMTPEEELAALKLALAEELGPETRRAIYERTKRR